jgi:site-specific DNA recombinase
MKVALYARVSTRIQEKKGTIGSQIAALRNYASEHKFVIAEEYICCDDGYSGAFLARPGLDRLRDGAQAGAFDAALVLSPDRLSRKYAYLILILEEFERFGTEVIFIEHPLSDDPHSALLIQIQGAVAEYERAKHAERYRRGKLYRARQGEVFWHTVPYGYRRIARCGNAAAHLVINEQEAEVVRNIFKWHIDQSMTIRQIAKRLTREGYPTAKGGKQWGETTVHRILHREAYVGTLYYNCSTQIFLPASEDESVRRKKISRPRAEWIPLSIPALIDEQTFQHSQELHLPNQQFSPRNVHEEHWLLRRLLRCEKCGLKCACVADKRAIERRPHLPPAYYYRCETQKHVWNRSRCRPTHIRSEPLDNLVWQKIRDCLLNPELLMKAQSKIRDAESLDVSFLSAQVQNVTKRLAQTKGERQRLVDIFQAGLISKQEFHERANKVIVRIDGLQNDLNALEAEHRNVAEGNRLLTRIRDFTDTITRKIDSMAFSQKQLLARKVLKEVVINENIVKLYFKIPLPTPQKKIAETTDKKQSANTLSMKLNLRSRRNQGMDVWIPVE